jgi:hypothetical protein
MDASDWGKVRCSECGAEYEDMLWFCPACGKLPEYRGKKQADDAEPSKDNPPALRTKANKGPAEERPHDGGEPEHRRFNRSLAIRVLITVAILALLLAAILLIASLRGGGRPGGLLPAARPAAAAAGEEPVVRSTVEESTHVAARRTEAETAVHGLRAPNGPDAEDMRGLRIDNASGEGRRTSKRS